MTDFIQNMFVSKVFTVKVSSTLYREFGFVPDVNFSGLLRNSAYRRHITALNFLL